jgi:hypothetical protein
MVSYPIVVRVIPNGRRISFPDFPGCCSIFKPPASLETEEALREALKKEALDYLVGSTEIPGWIRRRLKAGYEIVTPYTYAFHLLDSETELSVELPGEMQEILEFHRIRYDLQVDLAAAARILDMPLERYQLISRGLTRINHKDRAKLRFFNQRSQNITRVSQDSENCLKPRLIAS